MKKRMRMRTILAVLTAAALLCACGSAGKGMTSSYEMAADTAAYDTGGVYSNGAAYYDVPEAEYVYNEAAAVADYDYAEAPAAEAAEESIAQEGSVSVPEGAVNRKLIKTVNISAETEAFDELVPQLQKRVEELGGYIESISVYDVGSYYEEDTMQKQRCAQMTARVPKEALDGFLAQVGEQTNVTSRSEYVEDVTLQYVDLESHKKVLLTEQERLLSLMEQAESVEDIITIEGRLSEVRYQIESMESQFRTYDNKIDYSTVYLSIEEVRKYSAPQTATVWQRIGTGFVKSLEDIGFGIRDFAIGFVINIPYIVFWGVLIAVAVIVWRILRRAWKKIIVKRAAVRGKNETEQKQGTEQEKREGKK